LLAENLAEPWISGVVLAAVCFACWGATLLLPKLELVKQEGLHYLAHLKEVVINVWEVARSRLGYLALIIMLLPIGSGGVPWSAIANEWRAGGNMVAFVNGIAGGVASIVGALVAGYICDRMELKKAYSIFGLLVGLVAVSLIALPRTPIVFVGGVLAYQAMVGMAYTGYAAIVLEAIGKKSAATNWNLMAALSNVPIAVMSTVDGHVHDSYGTNAMLLGELAFPAIAILLFWLFVFATRPRAAQG
jgi:PAT family beta-lactamase induction signal transducer AmpG